MSTSDPRAVAAHVLRHLARAQSRGRAMRLDELACDIGIRREDVRHVVTSLHSEGHVDAKRMRLTMTGFALAASMRQHTLRDPIKRPAHSDIVGLRPPPGSDMATFELKIA